MATTSSRRTSSAGGKIVKNRRVRSTPYSRPSPIPASPDDTENPNWLSGLIYPAKVIASGAGKILSFFGKDDDSPCSSSSAAHSSEDDEEEDEIENDLSNQEDDHLDKVLSPPSKSDKKLTIEHLVIQETYSRKEANELIKLVRSRVVDTNGTFGETTPNKRSAAIMEARKWLQEKRSSSKKMLEDELDVSNMASPSLISKNEKGSPLDMARSYMQSRPAWASPSLKLADAGSVSPLGMLHFKEETPKSTLRSSELKNSSFTSGSWNLLDEIRRVRSKATEELLAAAPLTKTVLSSFSPASNLPQASLMNARDTEGAGLVDSTRDRPENVLQDAADTPSRVSQDGDAVQSMEHQESREAAELKYNNNDEVKHLKSATVENGFGCPVSGFTGGHDTTHDAQPSEVENGNIVDSSLEGRDILMEENLNLPQEPSSDIPTDTVINGSQNSSSVQEEQQEEQLSQDFSQPVAEDGPGAKVKNAQERKLRGHTRRRRGRGK